MNVKICHISDTHTLPFKIEPADILVHSGDALNSGKFKDLVTFRLQLEEIKEHFKHIVYVPGNHDWELQYKPKESEEFLQSTVPNLVVLHEKSIELMGLKFYGTAYQPFFCNWAFNVQYPKDLKEIYERIPDDTQVLVTHCPPYGILDHVINRWNPNGEHVGSKELADELPRLKALKLHMFGHIHYSSGMKLIDGVEYSNGAICDEAYLAVNKPNVIELEIK